MDLILEWLTIIVRWWHLLAGITWIGASFYFNWFDSLVRPTTEPTLRENNRGTLNEVHGGNFYYHEQYYPDTLPRDLHVHAWPSKMTFITGLLLLALIYWLGASAYMIDKHVADISPLVAILISAFSIVFCWLLYDQLCKKTKDNRIVLGVMAALAIIAAFAFQHVFGGRAAYISVGVMLGSMMGLNVWLVIAPKSISMQKQLRSGNGFNHDDGDQTKRRSQHNNYFTIPVVLTMVSNHFALAYNHQYAWLILSCLMFAGWGIRHSLNVWYKYGQRFYALYAGIAISAIAAIGISLISPPMSVETKPHEVSDVELMQIIKERCSVCHSQHPTQPGFSAAPQGLMLESIDDITRSEKLIRQRALITKDMPLANITNITEDERAQLKSALDRIENKVK